MIRTQVKPNKSIFKSFIVKAGFYALGRGAESLSRFNIDLKEELKVWEDGYIVQLRVDPMGNELCLQKTNGRLKVVKINSAKPDLIVIFKNLDTAFKIITTLNNVHTAFSQNRIKVYGDLDQSMVLIRLLNIVQAYLFPPFLSKNVLKKVPKFTIGQHIGRIRVYTTGLLFGV